MLIKGTALAALLLLSAAQAQAQDDPIAARQALMKRNGAALDVIVPMAREQRPFDAAAALDALETLAEDARQLDAERLFPDGTQTGGDTEASPRIWEDRAGFIEQIGKFRARTAAVLETPPQDITALRQAINTIGQSCGDCHETYRIKKD